MRLAIIIISVFCCQLSFAQQVPLYTNYNFNLFGINPAVAGSLSCLDLKMGVRRQWSGFEGAPTSQYAGIHGSFGKKKFNFHGAGFFAENDVAGRLAIQSLRGVYAYHMKVNRKNMFSAGMSFGFTQVRVGVSELILEDVNEPAIAGVIASQILLPKIDVGFMLKNRTRFIGLSIKNIVQNKIDGLGFDSRNRMHLFLTAGKSIPVDDKLFFKPSVNLRYVRGSPVAADVNFLFDYNELFEFGVSFRGGHGVSAMTKLAVLKYITVGYAYDRTLNSFRYGSASSHEILLGIQACPRGEKRGIPCSAYD